MKIEEAKKKLTNTKVYVNGKSKEIQEKLFKIGFRWEIGSKVIKNTSSPFMFLKDDFYIGIDDDMIFFKGHGFKEVSPDDILNIKIDEEFINGEIVKSEVATLVYRGINKNSAILSDAILVSEDFGDCIYVFGEPETGTGYLKEYSLATNEEKDNFLDRLEQSGYKLNEETKEIEKIEQPKKEHEFKPFDKVLVRDFIEANWYIDFFQEIGGEDIDYQFICLAAKWNFCIPYEGNEELLGTSNSPK